MILFDITGHDVILISSEPCMFNVACGNLWFKSIANFTLGCLKLVKNLCGLFVTGNDTLFLFVRFVENVKISLLDG